MLINKYFMYINLLQIMVIFAIACYETLDYNGWYKYPTWALGFGWLLTSSSLIWIPGYMLYKLCSQPGSLKEVSQTNKNEKLNRQSYYKFILVKYHKVLLIIALYERCIFMSILRYRLPIFMCIL